MFKLLTRGTQVGYLLGGTPPGTLGPPRGPRVSQSSGKICKNSQKLFKSFTCIEIPKSITLTPILAYLGTLGGSWGAKTLKWPCRGVI